MKTKTQTPENAFAAACQLMHNMANICHNWLLMADARPTQTIFTEHGCVRSTRLSLLRPATGEVTAKSALQIVVMPADFGTPGCHLYDHPRWAIAVYSWLGREATQKLSEHLASKVDTKHCAFFLVHPSVCEKTI